MIETEDSNKKDQASISSTLHFTYQGRITEKNLLLPLNGEEGAGASVRRLR